MPAVASLLIVVLVSILITRVATIALTHTGLSKETARFQARSAFTGSGFTTSESEAVVNHPVRRRIILWLMLIGNAGVVTVISTLILTFVHPGNAEAISIKIVLLVGGLTLLWFLAKNRWVDARLGVLIDRMLRRHSRIDIQDYVSLMHLAGEYRIVELHIKPEDWLADRTLAESGLREEGILVLGMKRTDGTFLGAPRGKARIVAGDTLICYGRVAALSEIDCRGKGSQGDIEHVEAVSENRAVAESEARHDPAER